MKLIFVENDLTKHINETNKTFRFGKLINKNNIVDIETNCIINTSWYWFMNDKESINNFLSENLGKTIKYEYKIFGDFNNKEFQGVIKI